MRYLIDSNIWIYAAAGEACVIGFLDNIADAQWIGYSAISRLELFGFPDLEPEDEGTLQKLLAFGAEVAVSSEVIDRAIVFRKETAVKTPDAIVAATAAVTNATLVTRNTDDFKTIKGLTILNPFDSADPNC